MHLNIEVPLVEIFPGSVRKNEERRSKKQAIYVCAYVCMNICICMRVNVCTYISVCIYIHFEVPLAEMFPGSVRKNGERRSKVIYVHVYI